MKKSLSLIFAAFLLATALPIRAENNPFGVSDDLDKSIRAGLHALYSLDFEVAEKIFDSIESDAKEHPMVAFGKASLHWWRLSVYVLEADQKESEAFIKAVNECIKLSKEKIERGDETGEAHMTLGGAYGLLGRWQATNQKWVQAYFTGKGAIKYLRKALKINSGMKDANMGLGIFDYYVATLPSAVRVLAFLGSKGDKQIGLDELEDAAHHGTYSQTPSQLFLTDLYSNHEGKPEKAFDLLGGLRKEYPVSPFIHMLHIITLYNYNHLDEMRTEIDSFKQRVDKGIYRKEFETNAHFAAGMIHFKSRNWAEAIKEYDLAIQNGTVKNPFLTWSELYKGYALDAMGKRDEALNQYKEVLREPRRWGSYDAAKTYTQKPFMGEEKNLEKIKL